MIPNHILDGLKPDEGIAVLSRGPELHFRVHPSADTPEAVRAAAAAEGSQVLATHLRDHAALLAVVTPRERDLGGES